MSRQLKPSGFRPAKAQQYQLTNPKSNAAGGATAVSLPGRRSHHVTKSQAASAGGQGFEQTSSHAAGWVFHQSMVSGCRVAPGSGSRDAYHDPSSLSSSANATAPSASMEYSPGAGPSDSMSIETNTSGFI